jgi:hypothetical protein
MVRKGRRFESDTGLPQKPPPAGFSRSLGAPRRPEVGGGQPEGTQPPWPATFGRSRGDLCVAWNSVAPTAPLPSYGCRSGTGSDRARADACTSSSSGRPVRSPRHARIRPARRQRSAERRDAWSSSRANVAAAQHTCARCLANAGVVCLVRTGIASLNFCAVAVSWPSGSDGVTSGPRRQAWFRGSRRGLRVRRLGRGAVRIAVPRRRPRGLCHLRDRRWSSANRGCRLRPGCHIGRRG